MTAKKKRIKKETAGQAAVTDAVAARDRQEIDWLHILAFGGMALLLFLTPYFRGLFFAPNQEMALIFAALLFWLAFLWRRRQNDRRFLRGPLDYFALALPVVYLLVISVAVNKGLAIDEVVKNLLYFLTFWSVSRLIRGREDIHWLLRVVYISALGVALAGLATATGMITIKDGFVQGRIYSTFQYPNALASYLGAAVLMGLYLWQRSYAQSGKFIAGGAGNGHKQTQLEILLSYLYAGGNFLLMAVFMGTKSRGGLLVFGLVVLIYLAGAGAKNRLTATLHLGVTGLLGLIAADRFVTLAAAGASGRAWLWIIAGLLAALIWQTLYQAGYAIISSGRQDRPGKHDRHRDADSPVRTPGSQDHSRQYNLAFAALAAVAVIVAGVLLAAKPALLNGLPNFSNLTTAFQRISFIGAAGKMIMHKPFLGWGGGGWREAYQAFMDYNYVSRQAHSFYLQTGVEAGFVGLAVIAGIWLSFLAGAWRLYRTGANQAVKELIWILLMIFLMIAGHAAIDFDLSLSALTLVLWSVFGAVAGLGLNGALTNAPAAREQAGAGQNLLAIGAVTVVALLIILPGAVLHQADRAMSRGVALLQAQQADAANRATSAPEARQALQAQQDAAVALLKKAAAYNPYNATYRITLAQVYRNGGETEKALAEAQRGLKLSSYSTAARNNLVQMAIAAGKLDLAAQTLTDMQALAPNDLTVYQNMTQGYAQLGQAALLAGRRQEAKGYLEQCLQVSQQMADYWNGLPAASVSMWEGPKLEVNPPMQLFLGEANYWLGDLSSAQKYLTQAAKVQNLQPEALLYLALLQHKQGAEETAQVYLQQAQRLTAGQAIQHNYAVLSAVQVL
ncbi:MAG: O-antigen ligase family protein [Firmicutes bacterium]|nr:O-antigen ligase family protein [Bacillota bacterium]